MRIYSVSFQNWLGRNRGTAGLLFALFAVTV